MSTVETFSDLLNASESNSNSVLNEDNQEENNDGDPDSHNNNEEEDENGEEEPGEENEKLEEEQEEEEEGDENDDDEDDGTNQESWIQVPVVQTLTVLSEAEEEEESNNDNNNGGSQCEEGNYSPSEELNESTGVVAIYDGDKQERMTAQKSNITSNRNNKRTTSRGHLLRNSKRRRKPKLKTENGGSGAAESDESDGGGQGNGEHLSGALLAVVPSGGGGGDEDEFGLGSDGSAGGGKRAVGRPVTSPRTMAQSFPSVAEIKDKLEAGECYTRARSSNSSSEVWSIFEEVADCTTDEFTGIVRCKLCLFMTRYHGQITGTSHMRRHTCFVTTFPGSNVRGAQSKPERKSGGGGSSSRKRKQETPVSMSVTTISKPQSSPVSQLNVLERFNEVRDATTHETVAFLSCQACKLLVKRDAPSINGHLCRQKDIEKQSTKPICTSTLLFRTKPKNRATPIWDNFEEVIDPTTNTILGYVRCKNCHDIIKASDPKSIPAVLRRHQPHCPRTVSQPPSLVITPIRAEIKHEPVVTCETPSSVTITPISSISSTPVATGVPSTQSVTVASSCMSSSPKIINAKADFRERCIKFCYQELVNLETITSDSFKKLAQSLMSLGAQYGRPLLQFPDTNQLYTQMRTYCSNTKNQIKTDLNIELDKGIGGALVCDSQGDLCVLSSYYINSNWQLVECVLNATTSACDINSFIMTTLNEYGLDTEEKMAKFTFVSRGGLFDGVDGSTCLISIAHAIDQTIDTTIFSDDTYTDIIENCRLICSQLKLHVLPEEPVQSVEWIQKFELLRNVIDSRSKFELKSRSLDLDLVKSMVDLLLPFKDASVELRRCSTHPTLNHVLLWFHKLMKVLSVSSEENDQDKSFTTIMKNVIREGMEQNFSLHPLHKVAAFLWPNFRFLKMLTNEERLEVHQEVRNLISTRIGNDEEYCIQEKKARSDFSDWEDITDIAQDEVQKYVSAMLTSCNEKNILQWWKEHQSDFPKLSSLTKWILSIPASVTSLEKHKLTSTQRVDDELLFLHCNSKRNENERKTDSGRRKTQEKLR